jgi:hypothetical protein
MDSRDIQSRKGRYGRWACALLLVAAGFGANAGNIDLEYGARGINLEARDAELREVLALLAERADFKLWVPKGFTAEPVNLRIESQSLEQVLRRLLHGLSFTLVVDSDVQTTRVKSVYLLPGGVPGHADIVEEPVDGQTDPIQLTEGDTSAQHEGAIGLNSEDLSSLSPQIEETGASPVTLKMLQEGSYVELHSPYAPTLREDIIGSLKNFVPETGAELSDIPDNLTNGAALQGQE